MAGLLTLAADIEAVLPADEGEPLSNLREEVLQVRSSELVLEGRHVIELTMLAEAAKLVAWQDRYES